ncbi:Translation initiation factor SUI1 [Musa troglodytarum]|uniref:Translation initiation factor SUI1 n=1 Tax=Musa troglodytarum TaxID=320322 RepID=A0A9E7F958_9LILI|nr:Translation initiation factor SUI1 [Musa troglodytarum]
MAKRKPIGSKSWLSRAPIGPLHREGCHTADFHLCLRAPLLSSTPVSSSRPLAKTQGFSFGADKKKLRRTTKERFPHASDADIDEILPPKELHKSLLCIFRMQKVQHAEVVYALWKVPELLPSFLLKGGEVSRYVIGGADLMFPGISIPPEGLPSFLSGQPWAVKVPGNPAPIAVGATTMSSSEALKAGLRGKALRITHYYRDYLWQSAEVSQPSDEPLDASNDADHVNTSERDCVDISNIHASTDIDAPLNLDVTDQISKEITADISGLKVSDNVTAEEPSDEKEQQTLSSEEIDALLDKCLLQALHTTISAKEDKYKKEVMLLGINRGHQEFMAFKPEKRVPENAEQRHDNSVSEVAHTKLQLEVVEVYKPSTHVKSIFTAVGADTGSYYSASDATDIAFRYVEKENLVKPTDKAMVVLDAALCDALYKGTIKKGSTYPTEVHKKDLGSTFLSRMQIHHRVSKGNEVAVRKGAVRPIQIMTERRQGNKKVTRVSGLETFLMDADSLASELQKKFACSTSVGEIPGKKGQHEVLVQGGVIDDLAKHLVDHYGIPKRYIEVLDKTKK